MDDSLVIMGVAGCGKSSLGQAVADAERVPLVEGDVFHAPASLDKMSRGIALDDADRDGWLARLASELRQAPGPVVLTCSALKRSYRDRLRAAAPSLGFVFLRIDREAALQRVAGRGGAHFFSASLVDSQFATLEPPDGEARVLTLEATEPLAVLRDAVVRWVRPGPAA